MIESLAEEVRFWEYMVREFRDTQPLTEYQRMTEALALAEYKLEQQILQNMKTRAISH